MNPSAWGQSPAPAAAEFWSGTLLLDDVVVVVTAVDSRAVVVVILAVVETGRGVSVLLVVVVGTSECECSVLEGLASMDGRETMSTTKY